MKKMILAGMVAMSVASNAFAGASNTEINCKSKDGKLSLQGSIPGDFAEFQLTATVKGNMTYSLSFTSEQVVNPITPAFEDSTDQLVVIEDLDQKVFTLQADDFKGDAMKKVVLYAIPSTVKVKKSGVNTSSTFQAQLSVDSENGSESARVSCTTKYEI